MFSHTSSAFSKKRLGPARIACIYAGFSALWILASGAFLQIAVSDLQMQGYIELAKGMLFVAVTSLLLYFLLKAWSAPWKDTSAIYEELERKTDSRRMLLAFVLLTLFVPLIGFGVYKLHAPQSEREAFANLKAIAELKSKQIESWMEDRRNVGVAMLANEGFIKRVANLQQSGSPQERHYVTSRLEAIRQAHGFENIILLNANRQLMLDLGNHVPVLDALAPDINNALLTGMVQPGNITLDKSGYIHWHYVVPLMQKQQNGNMPIGIVLLQVNPERFLFPYIQHWPGNSPTGETFLVMRDGDSVLFLNTLRHQQDENRRLRRPLSDRQLPAAAAIIANKPGTVYGVDYHGMPVLAAYRPIEGTQWHLVAKLDRAEVLEPLQDLSFWISIVAFFATIAISAAMLLFWRQQRYAQQLAIEHKADRLLRHFYDLPFIGMGIAEPDMNRWRQCNERLCEILGYSAAELSTKRWAALSHPEDGDTETAEFERLRRNESDSFKTNKRIIRKDGRVVFAAIHVRCVRTANGQIDFLVMTLQDITERKENEARIEHLTQLYAALSHCNQAIVRYTSEAELFSEICRIAVKFGGMKMAWIGMIEKESGLVRTAASFGMSQKYLNTVESSVNETLPSDKNLANSAIRENRAVWHTDFLNDPSVAERHERAAFFGWRAVAALPLRRSGNAVGVFALYAEEPYGFDQTVRDLLVEMMNDISFALDNFAREEARKRAESQLLLAAKVFEQSNEGFMITDAENRIVMVNKAFSDITGYRESEALGENPNLLSSGHQKPDFFKSMWEAIEGEGRWQGEILNRRKNGSLYLEWLSVSRVLDENGKTAQHIAIFSDITEHKATEERINWLMHFDTITGLPNRTLLDDRCRHAISLAQRSGTDLTLMFMDVDHFKNVNDSLGYRIGDTLLALFGQHLTSILREQDTVSRVGGDDFVIVLPGTDADGAVLLAEQLLIEVSSPFKIEQHELSMTVSIGIAVYPDNGHDLDTLSRCAEAAMYRAKQDGRNTFRFFAKEMQEHATRSLKLENALRRALEREQLLLHYQPQVCLESGQIVGAEALLRWEHPELGRVSPTEFVPIAESSGLILSIGEWVLRTAVRQMKAWLDQGLTLETMAVNLSAVQFRHSRLPDQVMQILNEAGLPPQYLELELTESAAMENPLAAIVVVNELHELGVRVSIDDFGTGHSSLGHLKRFNAYKLKIDRSFVRDIASDPEDRAIVDAIIRMASSLGMLTIAEGVETEEQLTFLRSHGCQEVQGYYFSQPVPAKQFETLLQEKKLMV